MAGETTQPRPYPSVQPGGRAPAPGALAIVQAFINTHYDLEVVHRAEVLATPAALGAWLAARGLAETKIEVDEPGLGGALAVRQGLGALAQANSESAPATSAAYEVLSRAAVGAAVEVRFTPGGPTFIAAPQAGVHGAIGVLLAITAQALSDGRWYRLKICPGRDCGWAFYDHSRNQAGRWCSMSVCGGRAKARNHYERRRGGAG
jgi:predicted RNA-binding Zn ribbon-like protein